MIELLFFLGVAGAIAWWFWSRKHNLQLHPTRTLGDLDRIFVELTEDQHGRTHVALGERYVWKGRDYEARILFEAVDAVAIAEMLRLAAAPGRTITQARVNQRRALRPKMIE